MKEKKSKTVRLATTGILACSILVVFFVALFSQERGKGRISGQVVDEAGSPIEGVQIVALHAGVTFESVTNEKGRFAIIGLGSGMWRISAKKEGYDPVSCDTEIFQLKKNPPIDFVMKRSQAAIIAGTGAPLIDQGNAAMAKGNYDAALTAYREFRTKFPAVYGIRVNIAAALMKKSDLAGAEGEYKGALEDILRVHGDYPKDKRVSVAAMSGLGEIALQRKELDAAQKHFSEALAISPDDEAVAFNVGEILFSNQKIDEAIRFFTMAVSIKKEWPKPYLKLGYVYLNKGDYGKSIENFNRFIVLDPGNPEAPTIKELIASLEKMKK